MAAKRTALTWPFAHLDGEWTQPPPGSAADDSLAVGRVGHSGVVVGDWLFLFGGVQPEDVSRERELSCLNVHTHQWHPLPCAGTPPTGRAWHSAAAVGDRLLLFGGSNGRKLFGDLHELLIEFSEEAVPEPQSASWSSNWHDRSRSSCMKMVAVSGARSATYATASMLYRAV